MNDFGKDVYKSDSEMGAYIEIRNRTLKALRHVSGMPNKPMDAIEDLQESLKILNNRIEFLKNNDGK